MPNKTVANKKIISFIVIAVLLNFTVLAQNNISRLLTNLQNAPNDSIKIDVYNEIFEYYQYSNPDSAIYYLQDGLKKFSAKNNRNAVASITALLANEDNAQGRIGLAQKRLTDALKIFEEVDNKSGIASVQNSLGVIDGKSGRYDSAVKHFMIALKLYESSSDNRGVINTYLKLGVVNEVRNDLDIALEYYNKALNLTPDTPIISTKVYLYNNIGIIYGKKGDLKKSLEYFQKALQNSSKPEFTDVRILSLMNTGIAYHEFGDDGKALKYYDEALQITKNKNLPEEYAHTIINIAAITSHTDPAKSIAQLNEALDIVNKLGNKAMLEEIYNGLLEDYKKTGNYKKALSIMEQQRDLEDSLYKVGTAKEITNLESVYELEQSNTRIKELNLIGHRDLLKRNIIIIIAISLTLVLIFISVYFRKTKILNEKLSIREAELKKSNNIKDKLFSIIGHDLRSPIGNIPMMLEILEDETTTPDERKYLLDTMAEHVQASMETLDKLLYWGKSQIKGSGIKPEKFNTAAYLQNNIKLVKSRAELKQITIINKVDTGLSIYCDTAHFDFIIRNLLSNAIKFTHSNGIIEISATDNKHKPGFTVFAVKDSGIGMEQEKLAGIFEPFSSSATGTANEKGTSMGLILCKEFVIENGGDICVESELGKGSVFYCSFKSA